VAAICKRNAWSQEFHQTSISKFSTSSKIAHPHHQNLQKKILPRQGTKPRFPPPVTIPQILETRLSSFKTLAPAVGVRLGWSEAQITQLERGKKERGFAEAGDL